MAYPLGAFPLRNTPSIPMCDLSFPHHYGHHNESTLLPHRACHWKQSKHQALVAPTHQENRRIASFSLPTPQPVRQIRQIRQMSQPSSCRQDHLPIQHISSAVRHSKKQFLVNNISKQPRKLDVNVADVITRVPVPTYHANHLSHHLSHHQRQFSAPPLTTPNSSPVIRNTELEGRKRDSLPILSLNKPLPAPPQIQRSNLHLTGISSPPRSANLSNSSSPNNSTDTANQCRNTMAGRQHSRQVSTTKHDKPFPKTPTPLKLFPTTPKNSMDGGLGRDYTINTPESSYFTPQVSVFEEDDDEKMGLLDYFRVLRIDKKSSVTSYRDKNIKRSEHSKTRWRFICFPCGR